MIAVFSLVWSFCAWAASPSVTLEGNIIGQDNDVIFVTDNGRVFQMERGAAPVFKYTSFRIEILNPRYPTDEIIKFTHYRILKSDQGETIDSSVRTIMSVKNKRPYLDFRIHQQKSMIRFSLHLTNRGDAPIKLRFPSTQKFDFVVMTPDKKTTLWRWSWNQQFQVGFNDVVILSGEEVTFGEKWQFQENYIEDGEYIAFAEVHCMPHGMLSELKKIIIQEDRRRILLKDFFIPLKIGNSWTYRLQGTDHAISMEITGLFRWGGKEYFIFTFFPDSLHVADGIVEGEGDSRIIRFDRATSQYLEWLPDGERPLLHTDETHRLFSSREPCTTVVGRFERCMEYCALKNKKWKHLYTFIPGIGLTTATLEDSYGKPIKLEISDFRFRNIPESESGMHQKASDRPSSIHVTMKKTGGLPPEDVLYSLRSNGSFVVLDKGQILDQVVFSSSDLWSLVQFMDKEGLHHLKESYGDNPVDNPLTITLCVTVNGNSKQVVMQTSSDDKPPMAFWRIIDQLEDLVSKIRQNNE